MVICNRDVSFKSYVTCTQSYGAGNMGQEKNVITGKQVLSPTTQTLKLLTSSCTQFNKTENERKKQRYTRHQLPQHFSHILISTPPIDLISPSSTRAPSKSKENSSQMKQINQLWEKSNPGNDNLLCATSMNKGHLTSKT